MTLNHVGLPLGPADFNKMRDFYLAILRPLGYKVFKEQDAVYCGLQSPTGSPDIWLHCGGQDVSLDPSATTEEKHRGKVHVAFSATSRKQVDEWYRNAV